MPPKPDFCYYEALEVTKTATQDEIKASFRQLALQRHPDKNPGDPNATANFQKISAANETLSDPAKRERYDNLIEGVGQTNGRYNPYSSSDDDDDFYQEDPGYDDFGFLFDIIFGSRGGFFSSGSPSPPSYEEMRASFAAEEAAEKAHREQILKAYRAKQQELEDSRIAKEEARRAAEEMKKNAFETREKGEREAQILRWTAANITTEEEKQDTCLHSEFWTKIQQKKKFKCGSCGKKRGMTAFKCPHCALLACQVCLNEFGAERRRLSC